MKKSLKEWNAVIEALGHGKQSLLVRKNKTLIDEFFLYPTVSYALKDDYLDHFQDRYKDFVVDNSLPLIVNNKVEIKYLAKVEEIKKVSTKKMVSLSNHYIWTTDHVKNYLDNKNGYIWLLRVYELDEPFMAYTKPQAITFGLLTKDYPTNYSKPVLNESDFNKIRVSI